ncbi:MAG TPA: PEGA domain-containing protein [bacterium]|nr:PEGA domain-containing protein [bacterium]
MRNKLFHQIVILIFLCFCFTNLNAQGSGKINIAVMNLETPDLSSSVQQALSDRLRTELFNTGRFSVMERNQMQELLTEQGFQQSGCTSNECVVEAGRLLGVDRMIAGSVGKVGTIYTVSLRMIDIETGRIMLTKTEDCNCPIEEVLTTSLKNIALKMAGMSSSAEVQPAIRREAVAGQGDFFFKSDPPGARVYVDDQLLSGTTPLLKEGIPAGTHQIRMEKDVYSGSQTVFLEPDEFKKVDLALVKAKGGLKIVTSPLEADIFLDNKPLGLSPQTLTGLDAGEHILKLS